MLNHGHNVGVSRPISSAWTEDEWDLIGKEFMRLHPKWQTTVFTLEDVEDVMESVIPQGKHRSFATLDDVLKPLFDAFHRLQKGGYKTNKVTTSEANNLGKRIKWTPEEWANVVLQFNLDHPGAFEQRLAKVSLRDVNEASDILPLARHRKFFHVSEFRDTALKFWDEISPEVRLKDGQTRAVKEFANGVIVEPQPMKSDANSALATAMHKAFQAPEKVEPVVVTTENRRKKSVHWEEAEWLKVCMEMRRQNPHTNYLTSSFSKIDLAAMRAAQGEVLPLERRKALKQPGGLQGPLCKTFRIIKGMLEEAKQKETVHAEAPDTDIAPSVNATIQTAQETEKPAPVPVAVAEKVPTLAPEPAPVLEVEQIAEVAEAPIRALFQQAAKQEITHQVQGNDFLQKMLKAAMPMADVMVDELALRLAPRIVPGLISQMLPELTKAMFPMLEAAIADLKRAAMPIYVPSVQQPAPAPFTHPAHVEAPATAPAAAPFALQEVYKIPVVKTVKKPLIAMLGPIGNQISELEAAFPEFSFVFIQNGHGIKEAGAKAEVFIASNKYLNGANRQNIKKYITKEKLRFVDGGMTTYKHLINAWKAEHFNQFQ
ncbi:MAG: hypothetical protein V4621_07570 [Pseudomonadota bacterium]